MRYNIAPLYCRPWTLNGITPRLIESHYENDYGSALNRLNAIAENSKPSIPQRHHRMSLASGLLPPDGEETGL